MPEKIDLSSFISAFSDFFTSIYKDQINRLISLYPDKRSLNIDYTDLEKFDPELADKLIHAPDLIIESAEQAIKEMNLALPDGTGQFTPHARFFNLPGSDALIENIGSKNINELVVFKGVVTRRAETMHKVKLAVYRCQVCDTDMRVIVTKNFVAPKRCDSCKKFALRQIDEESRFTDIQRAEVQELLERVRGGAPAAHIELLFEDDTVNTVSPGDNIEIAGIIRLRPPIKTRTKQELVYSRYLDVVHVKGLKRDFEEIEISKEDERHILELSRDPNIENIIISSIASGIYGHREVKHSLALQLFGGTKGKFMSDSMPIRDDIHLLLIGDPGLAKCISGDSQIMLNDGSILGIKDVVEEVLTKDKKQDPEGYYGFSNHALLSMDQNGKTMENKATAFWKLKSPDKLYKFETASGKVITVTPTHPFFVTEDALISPKKAEEVSINDFIATPNKLEMKCSLQLLPNFKHGKTNANKLTLPKYLDERFARFLGYIIGDGYVRRTTSYEISLTNCERSLIEDFIKIVKTFGIEPYIKKTGITYSIYAFSIDLGNILEELKMVRTSFYKSVPLEIMKSPNSVLKEFIKSYFDCEAHVSKDGIAVSSASEKLLKHIQLLLLRFEILSQLHPNYTRATNAKNHKRTKYYRLVLCGENAKKYFSEIGFTNSSKSKKIGLMPRNSNTNINIIPGLSKILKDIRLSLGLSQFKCGIPRSTYQHFERGDRNPSYGSLRKIVGAFKKKELEAGNKSILLKFLEKTANANIFWDRIVKKEKIVSENEWVYDLQVNNVHNFIADGLFVHNSRFLQSVSELAPKSIYVSGKSVSSAGLTVSAEKDELGEGGWVLKAGALVLASGGSAQIDEFDKIEDEDRAALHEAMESQSISVAKAGIVAKFKTKTSILAAANPKYGRFDQNKNLVDQFQIPPTLLSRFDLIFPIVDVLDEEKDAKLAQHILSAHMGKKIEQDQVLVDKDILRRYIAYARRQIFPQLTQTAIDKIKDFYVDLRRRSKGTGSVAITPRYLEGLVRLAEANAKMRLSNTVEEKDADTAIFLMNYVMKQVMTDRATGVFDIDVVATGKPKSEREKLQKADTILDIIKDHLRKQDSADIEKVIIDASAYGINEQEARKILTELLRRGELYEKEHGHVKLVGERK